MEIKSHVCNVLIDIWCFIETSFTVKSFGFADLQKYNYRNIIPSKHFIQTDLK